MNEYIANELQLPNTAISASENDAYLPSGAATTSTVTDMLGYARLHMGAGPEYILKTHEALVKVDAPSLADSVSAVGAAWLLDEKRHIIWHNGAMGKYNCYLGFDSDKQLAVVILSNLSVYRRFSATDMGAKLLHELAGSI